MIGVVVVAGGIGKRMGADIPKQFIEVDGLSIFQHCLLNWWKHLPDAQYIIVMHEDYHDLAWKHINQISANQQIEHSLIMVSGGKERFHSVQNGLFALQHGTTEISQVAITDAVRPNMTEQLIQGGISGLRNYPACIPAIPIVDSIREIQADGSSKSVDRSKYKAVQTPQWFDFQHILTAYQQTYQSDFTDCASVYEAHYQEPVSLYHGDSKNIKITHAKDIHDLLSAKEK